MVSILSYIIAVIMTIALAVLLYPIAALFWVFGLLGKLSEGLFNFTKKAIAALWKDLKDSERMHTAPQPQPQPQSIESEDVWTCSCGHTNTGRFCSECGSSKPQEEQPVEA